MTENIAMSLIIAPALSFTVAYAIHRVTKMYIETDKNRLEMLDNRDRREVEERKRLLNG